MKRCSIPTCHEDNPNDAVYCHMCGRKIKTEQKWPIVVGVIIATLNVLGFFLAIVEYLFDL